MADASQRNALARALMDAPPYNALAQFNEPQPNALASRGTLKPGPEPTGYDRLFDGIYGALGGTPDRRALAEALSGAVNVGTLGMATGAYDGGAHLARTGEVAPLALALMPGAKIAQPIETATKTIASGARNALDNTAFRGILASRNEAGHLPPAMTQRAFTDDYRRAPKGHPGSQLKTDIDGRPLTAQFVAGRRTVDGPDEGLSEDQIREIAAYAASLVDAVPRSQLPARSVGAFDEATGKIRIANDLSPEAYPVALAHETGHALHDWGKRVGLDASRPDAAARRVYHDLAYGEPAKVKSQIRDPEFYGYKKSEVPGELTAEVIRAYMQDPNYLKSVSPALAKEVRKLNAIPGLNEMVQFNSPLAGLGLTGAGLWNLGGDEQ